MPWSNVNCKPNTVYKLSLLYSVVVRDSTFNILRISNNVDVSVKVSVYLGKLPFYKVQPQLTSKYSGLAYCLFTL